MNKIGEFREEYYFLSNFYPAEVTYEGIIYLNNEAAFQAMKCIHPADRKQFANLSPSEAKKLGRRVCLRKDWEDVKVGIMRDLVYSKFSQNPELLDRLLDTENAYLEEGNTWGDRIWGTVNGCGQNLLGQILMEARENFQNERTLNREDERTPEEILESIE